MELFHSRRSVGGAGNEAKRAQTRGYLAAMVGEDEVVLVDAAAALAEPLADAAARCASLGTQGEAGARATTGFMKLLDEAVSVRSAQFRYAAKRNEYLASIESSVRISIDCEKIDGIVTKFINDSASDAAKRAGQSLLSIAD